MAEYLAKLCQGHAEALESARHGQVEGDGLASKKQKQDGSVNTVSNTSGGAYFPLHQQYHRDQDALLMVVPHLLLKIYLPVMPHGMMVVPTMSEEDETEQEHQTAIRNRS